MWPWLNSIYHDICLDIPMKMATNVSEPILSWDRDLKQRPATCYPFESNEVAFNSVVM